MPRATSSFLSPMPAGNTFQSILAQRLSRRAVLGGGLNAISASILGSFGLAGCSDNDGAAAAQAPNLLALSFTAVAKSLEDRVAVPAGYTAKVLYALGDPLAAGLAPYANDGSDTDMDQRAGDHHDGMAYFGLDADGDWDPAASMRGLICINHEQITQSFLHTSIPNNANARDEAEVLKEMHAHGVAVFEASAAGGDWAVVQGSAFNRRITPLTPMELHGPARGSAFTVTAHDPTGQVTRGTINNCANGYTPWGTYLTCEENWNGYFKRGDDTASRTSADNLALRRYGLAPNTTGFAHRNWSSVYGDEFQRWLLTASGPSVDGSDDYRNEANTFGYVVEIDPFDPSSTPRKRTALGRMGHEGCWIGPVTPGQPVVFYMGDDARYEYIYKFVSDAPYDPADRGLAAGDKYLDSGTLYVAKFNADGSGEWLALVHNANGLNASNPLYPFANQASICVNTRLAADAVGGTRMDRPEWGAVHPANGEVYFTLTNNSARGNGTVQSSTNNYPESAFGADIPVDAANPRSYDAATGDLATSLDGNVNGHIIRWRESSDDAAATTFAWDIYLFGSRASYPAQVNVSGLVADNDFSSPDGLWFDPRGVLWIQTDDGAYTDTTNCMMLAAVPGRVGDGAPQTIGAQATRVGAAATADTVRRFLVGPKQCEITGICMTPDGKTMFFNVQHPGEDTLPTLGVPASYGSRWPASTLATDDAVAASSRPRSALVVVTRDDGGVIAV